MFRNWTLFMVILIDLREILRDKDVIYDPFVVILIGF